MKPQAPRIRMPSIAKLGDVIQIKTKIRHPMETGWRKDGEGKSVPRNRITRFVCTFQHQGQNHEVISADYDSGVSADPYLVFYSKVIGAGTYTFEWQADGGNVYSTSVPMSVAELPSS